MTRCRRNESGVALYVALPLAFLMIGAAWSIVGFGDLVLFRTRGQEAADAAALSSAVTHAQGMNLIAALNVAMIALTGTYVAMRYLADIINILLGINRSGFGNTGGNFREDQDAGRFRSSMFNPSALGYQQADVLTGTCGSDSDPYCPDRSNAQKSSCATKNKTFGTNADGTVRSSCDVSKPLSAAFWKLAGGPLKTDVNGKMLAMFEKNVLGEAMNGLSTMQMTLQRVQPMAALANSILVTDKLNLGGIGVGLSSALLIPRESSALRGGKRTGLPVNATRPKSALCEMFGRSAADVAIRSPDRVPAPSSVRLGAMPRIWPVLYRQDPRDRFCADRFLRTDFGTAGRPNPSVFWSARDAVTRENHGPKMVLSQVKGIQNGGEGFQVFGAMTLRPKDSMTDKAMAGLALSQRVFRKGPPLSDTAPTTVRSYVAQAEFYLECGDGDPGTGTWSSPGCNGNNMGAYRMNWRARLRWLDTNLMAVILAGRAVGELDHWIDKSPDALTMSSPGGATMRVLPSTLIEKLMPAVGAAKFYH